MHGHDVATVPTMDDDLFFDDTPMAPGSIKTFDWPTADRQPAYPGDLAKAMLSADTVLTAGE